MTGPLITHTLKLCQKIREINPNLKIVWGGPHPTLLPEETLRHKLVDIIVISEGERTVVELTQALKNNIGLRSIKGLGYKEDEKLLFTAPREFITNWDEEVGLDWEGVKIKDYLKTIDQYTHLPLITSRGCPFRCRFCWNLKANRKYWRGWSADRIITELKKLLPFGVNYISFMDDNFGVDIKRVIKTVEFMKQNNIIWAFEGFRVGMRLTSELIKFFKEHGCHHLYFGAECGTQKMLDYIAKDITIEQLLESAKLTGKYRIGIKYSWILGFPQETQLDRLKLLDLIDELTKLNPNCSNYIGIFSPYPGSELYQETIAAGWKPPVSIEEWSMFREETNLPYCKNMWYLRSIALTCLFKFALDSTVRSHSKSKAIYRIPFKLLKITSNFRWKHRWFNFPLEYVLLTTFKKLYNKIKIAK